MSGLYLDGRNRGGLPSPTVNGRRISFRGNDVTNRRTAICFALGHARYGVARRVNIQRNRIHHCGRVPATNLEHGLYINLARDTRVVGNWIFRNADRGIQLYADARRSYIAGNVIDSNGQGIIFGGDDEVASSDNLVEGNVISNSTIRHNLESFYERGDPVGSGNVVRRNCIGGGVLDAGSGGIRSPAIGFQAVDNVIALPAFLDGEGNDYRLARGGPCAGLLKGDPDRVPGPAHQVPRRR